MKKDRHLDRNMQILQQRTNGRTLADIGAEFAMSPETERHNKNMCSPIWYARLSVRAQNVLLNYKLTDKDEAILAFSGKDNLKCANAGAVTMSEIKTALRLI
jgi:DNA-directed RNA polymerase alpha subunit